MVFVVLIFYIVLVNLIYFYNYQNKIETNLKKHNGEKKHKDKSN
jgi:hypothetical protein